MTRHPWWRRLLCRIGWHSAERIGFTLLCNPAWGCRYCPEAWVDYWYAQVHWRREVGQGAGGRGDE